MAEEKKIGVVTHYYTNLGVGIFLLEGELKAGDKIHIKGATTDITQTVGSMQLQHKEIESGKKGDEVGVKVDDKVREGDEVYLVAS